MQLYKPICFSTVFFNPKKKYCYFLIISTKVVNNRTIAVANKAMAPTHTSFIKRRFILDGVTYFMKRYMKFIKAFAILLKVHLKEHEIKKFEILVGCAKRERIFL